MIVAMAVAENRRHRGDPVAWGSTRALIAARYGERLARAIVERIEESKENGHASPHAGSIVPVADKRSGYVTLRGRVMWNRTRYEVYVGIPRDAKSLEPYADRCRRQLNAKIKDLEAGTASPRDKEKTTLRQWATAWLAMKKGQVRSTTLSGLEVQMRLNILPVLGWVRLVDLTPEMIRGLYAHHEGRLAVGTIRLIASCLKNCLRDAQADGHPIPPTVLSKATRAPSPARAERVVATPAMLRRLLDATRGDREHALWHVVIWTGGRLSEPLALRWSDVDLETGAATIGRRLSYLSSASEPDFGPAKTNRVLVVYLPAEARDALRAHRERQAADAERLGWPASDLVFRSSSGRHLVQVVVRDYWRAALAEAELPYFPIRQLRHSLATNLGLVGVSIEDVKDVLGHTEIGRTDRYHRQQLPEKSRAAIEALASLMGTPAFPGTPCPTC
jgi:integrase